MKPFALIQNITEGCLDGLLLSLYGEAQLDTQKQRYIAALKEFSTLYGELEDTHIFSVPGRSEISGNHTDHNRGCVLAASIDLDMIAIAAATDDGVIRLKSEGFDADTVSIADRDSTKTNRYSSASLIAGVADGMLKAGYTVGGFVSYTTNNVFKGSGLSSSAAFEVMIGNILRTLYHNDISDIEIAKIAQYAENEFFGKPCGLMDQTACAVGGFIAIDFEDPKNPIVEKPSFDLSALGYSLCIVNTGGNHADLNEDYASVPAEMKAVAKALGKEVLREVSYDTLFHAIPTLRQTVGDRAILRALHYLAENKRVARQSEALASGDVSTFLALVNESGASSFRYLQNVYTVKNVEEQGLSLALALTERFLAEVPRQSACRVHGGGFAGTIQAFVPEENAADYAAMMDAVFGAGACHILKIRQKGAIALV
ncbi:MAG: galactokinase [Clostridia bacterium]|nr:galactokinase [Clostridia bacterium]